MLYLLLETGLSPIRPEGEFTFKKNNKQSMLDFVSVPNKFYNDTTSRILDQESGSDHRYILTKCKLQDKDRPAYETSGPIWRFSPDKPKNAVEIISKLATQNMDGVEDADKIMAEILRILDNTLSRNTKNNRRRMNTWWTSQLTDIRRKVQRHRRTTQ